MVRWPAVDKSRIGMVMMMTDVIFAKGSLDPVRSILCGPDCRDP